MITPDCVSPSRTPSPQPRLLTAGHLALSCASRVRPLLGARSVRVHGQHPARALRQRNIARVQRRRGGGVLCGWQALSRGRRGYSRAFGDSGVVNPNGFSRAVWTSGGNGIPWFVSRLSALHLLGRFQRPPLLSCPNSLSETGTGFQDRPLLKRLSCGLALDNLKINTAARHFPMANHCGCTCHSVDPADDQAMPQVYLTT